MSNSTGIAAATAALRNLLQFAPTLDPVGDGKLIGADVTTQPPDKARNSNSGNQLNLFLYQTAPDAALRNMDMPRQVKSGETAQPPLALTLYYLVTAYGKDDDDVLGHRLLGIAMSILHDHPLLGADEIEQALAGTDLHEQLERVRITPQPLSLEELSNLWNTFQTQYRISAAYQVSVVLIESTRGTKAPLPVLTRGPQDEGPVAQGDLIPPFPTLVDVSGPTQEPSVRLGDRLLVRGHHLEGVDVTTRFTHDRLAVPIDVAPLPGRTATELLVQLPDDPAGWPAGFWGLVAVIGPAGQPDQARTTNELVIGLAPRILTITPQPAHPNPFGTVMLHLTCSPEVRPGQRATLLLGDREVRAESHPAQTDALTFVITNAPLGTHFVRLRVDGVDSLLIDRTVAPPVFDDNQRVEITP